MSKLSSQTPPLTFAMEGYKRTQETIIHRNLRLNRHHVTAAPGKEYEQASREQVSAPKLSLAVENSISLSWAVPDCMLAIAPVRHNIRTVGGITFHHQPGDQYGRLLQVIGGTQQVRTDKTPHNSFCPLQGMLHAGTSYLSSGALYVSSPGSRDCLTIPAE